MCTRFTLTAPPATVRDLFGANGEKDFPPRYNIAPTQPVLIIRNTEKQERELRLVRWGLIPSWAKDPAQIKSVLINARSETAQDKPSFRGPLRHRRCLVPATGYYEWTGQPGAKQPHIIETRAGTPLFAMAGLWEHWLGADGSELESMTILTTGANQTMGSLHDRMPVVIQPEDFSRWLDCRSGTAEFTADLLRAAPEDFFQFRKVSRNLNNVRNEGPGLIEPESPRLL